MRLPASERKAQILRTAAELFSQQGYEGTKTSQIAREAGVNEAIIFRHFTNKEELYWAVLEDGCCTVSLGEHLRNIMDDEPDMESALITLGCTVLERVTSHPQLMRLLFFAALENHKLSHRFFRLYTANKYEELADYIRSQIKSGAFRDDVDPVLAARGFLGSLIYHNQIQELFGGNKIQRFDPRFVVENFVKIWMRGMSTQSAPVPMLDSETRTSRRIRATSSN
jgi:AcrR family transcriptional regulator